VTPSLAPAKPQKDVKNDIMSLFEKVWWINVSNFNLWSTDTDTDIRHDTDTDTSTLIIIWENDIIQCNHMCRAMSCRTNLRKWYRLCVNYLDFSLSIVD
jgi:hypothetical protein